MEGFLAGLIGGMLVTYAFIYPETVKMLCDKLVAQLKKMCGK